MGGRKDKGEDIACMFIEYLDEARVCTSDVPKVDNIPRSNSNAPAIRG